MRLLFALFALSLWACGPAQYQTQPEFRSVSYLHPKTAASDSQVLAIIAPYRQQLQAEMNTIVGTAAKDLPLSQPESLMGNWAADLVAEYCRSQSEGPVDFAVLNLGGLRIPSLPKGPITKGKLFELMPFDNTLVILEVSGEVVEQLFQHIALKGGWPVSKEVRLTIKDGRAKDMQLEGKPIRPKQKYHIATNSYVASGGDDCSFFIQQKRVDLGIFFRDALIQYSLQCSQKGQAIDAELEQRIELIRE